MIASITFHTSEFPVRVARRGIPALAACRIGCRVTRCGTGRITFGACRRGDPWRSRRGRVLPVQRHPVGATTLGDHRFDDRLARRDAAAIAAERDALTLARDLPEAIDLVLLDGHKPLYPRILDLVAPRLRPGACLVADNVEASPEYLARVRKAGGYLSVPFAGDVELSIRL